MVELGGTQAWGTAFPTLPSMGSVRAAPPTPKLRAGGKGGSEEASVVLPGVCDGIDEQQVGRGLPEHTDTPTWQCPEGTARIAVWFWCL